MRPCYADASTDQPGRLESATAVPPDLPVRRMERCKNEFRCSATSSSESDRILCLEPHMIGARGFEHGLVTS